MPERKAAFLRCRSGFWTVDRRVVKGGDVVRADDPVVVGREMYFEPLTNDVIQATKAPGEMRISPQRPRPRPAADPARPEGKAD